MCHEEIHGRRDKQFCSDYCRAASYNNLNVKVSTLIRRINYTMRRNRNILAQFSQSGENHIHKRDLTNAGFNFNYFTSTYTTPAGNTYHFCYDQGYLALDGEYYALAINDDQLNGLNRIRLRSHAGSQ